MFKGINRPQSTLNFPFFVSIHRGHATEELRANKYSRFPLASRKSLQKLSGCSGGQGPTGRAAGPPCGTTTELFVQTIRPLFGSFSLSLSLTAREEHISIFQLQSLAAFVYVRKHIWKREWSSLWSHTHNNTLIIEWKRKNISCTNTVTDGNI